MNYPPEELSLGPSMGDIVCLKPKMMLPQLSFRGWVTISTLEELTLIEKQKEKPNNIIFL